MSQHQKDRIQNDRELEITLGRFADFVRQAAHMRRVENHANYETMGSPWLAEIAHMHNDIQDFLRTPVPSKVPAESDRHSPAGLPAPAETRDPENVRH
jgi:hypothetical protein